MLWVFVCVAFRNRLERTEVGSLAEPKQPPCLPGTCVAPGARCPVPSDRLEPTPGAPNLHLTRRLSQVQSSPRIVQPWALGRTCRLSPAPCPDPAAPAPPPLRFPFPYYCQLFFPLPFTSTSVHTSLSAHKGLPRHLSGYCKSSSIHFHRVPELIWVQLARAAR